MYTGNRAPKGSLLRCIRRLLWKGRGPHNTQQLDYVVQAKQGVNKIYKFNTMELKTFIIMITPILEKNKYEVMFVFRI